MRPCVPPPTPPPRSCPRAGSRPPTSSARSPARSAASWKRRTTAASPSTMRSRSRSSSTISSSSTRSTRYFLASDVQQFSIYRDKFDDMIHSGNIDPGFLIFDRFKQRNRERWQYAISLLEIAARLERQDELRLRPRACGVAGDRGRHGPALEEAGDERCPVADAGRQDLAPGRGHPAQALSNRHRARRPDQGRAMCSKT